MTAYEFIALDEPGLKLLAPGASDTYIANRAVHFTQLITTDSTIDGRDIAADGANLDTAVQTGADISVLVNDSGFTNDQTGAEIKVLYEAEASAFTNAQFTKLGAIENAATADQTDGEIETAYQTQVPLIAQATAESGIATAIESWSALRVKQAIVALASQVGYYGVMSCQIGVTGESVVDATPRKVAAWNVDGVANGTTVDSTTGNDITIVTPGVYKVDVSISFTGTSSKTYQLEIYKNGLTTGFAVDRKLGTSGDVGSASIHGIMACVATDTIEVYQSTSDGGSALTVTEAQLTVARVAA